MITEDSGDAEILAQTVRDGKDGSFKITLEDGHVLQGGPVSGAPDFQTVSGWCEAVRQEVGQRVERLRKERLARAQREDKEDHLNKKAAGLSTYPGEVVQDPGSFNNNEPEPEVYEEDPLAYAIIQQQKWSAKLHTMKEQAVELTELLDKASENYERWSKIRETLENKDD
jgi:hypothetical protein